MLAVRLKTQSGGSSFSASSNADSGAMNRAMVSAVLREERVCMSTGDDQDKYAKNGLNSPSVKKYLNVQKSNRCVSEHESVAMKLQSSDCRHMEEWLVLVQARAENLRREHLIK
jgi:hypothetical protein